MRRGVWAFLIVAVVALAGGATLVYLNGGNGGNDSTITAPTFPGYPAVATDSNSAIGISLSLALNSTTVNLAQGQDLQTVVQVLNTLQHVDSVSVGNDFPISPVQSKCLPGDYTPFVVQMYYGDYGRNNISSAVPMSYSLSCPAASNDSLTAEYYYLFQPNSYNATLYGRTQAGSPGNTGPMRLHFVNQISIRQFFLPSGTYPKGVYTLMVEDWWGQMVILPFSIVS